MAGSSVASWEAEVVENVAGVHGVDSLGWACEIWGRERVSACVPCAQSSEGPRGSTVAQPRAVAPSFSFSCHVGAWRGQREKFPATTGQNGQLLCAPCVLGGEREMSGVREENWCKE